MRTPSQLEIIELGNAKEQTKGPFGPRVEDSPLFPPRPLL